MTTSTPTRRLLAAGATALAATAATLAPNATAAAPADPPTVLAKKLVTPLSVDVGDKRAVYYSANFAGQLYVKRGSKKPELLFQSKRGKEVGAIAVDGAGVYFVHGFALMHRNWRGKMDKVAGLAQYEKAENPDGDVAYGAPSLSEECAAQWPEGPQAPPQTYNGILESHPYGSAVDGRKVYVADAAGNSILKVGPGGAVRTVAVLPPAPVEITAEMAEAFSLPECAVGADYLFESVPTDVEVGPDGMLYVSTLGGGPEDASVNVPGSVYKVDPASGEYAELATGLVKPTGLDVTPNGSVYVSELFAGRITRIPAGGGEGSTFAEAPLPAAVEIKGGKLYATINVLSDPPNGKVVAYQR